MSSPEGLSIWTVGHSTRAADDFLALLKGHDIRAVADVRRFPGSRRHPHFSREALDGLLRSRGIAYHWMPELGGRRSPRPGSTNTGWRVAAFRGYADYVETPEFRAAFDALLQLAARDRTVIMCAEALWWQCHRRLIADALVAEGCAVMHILSAGEASPHKLLPPATLSGGRLSYASEQPDLGITD